MSDREGWVWSIACAVVPALVTECFVTYRWSRDNRKSESERTKGTIWERAAS